MGILFIYYYSYESAIKIRELESKGQLNPCLIIAVTAYTSVENNEKCIQAGMNLVLSKPVSINALQAAFNTLTLS